MKNLAILWILPLALVSPIRATVLVSSPANGSTVNGSVPFVATSTASTCSKGVAAMGIYINNKSVFVVNGIILNTTLQLAPGKSVAAIQEWDFCGGTSVAQINLTVNDVLSVSATSPANGSTSGSVTPYLATGTTNCPGGISSMGIYVDGVLMYTSPGGSLNTPLDMGLGLHQTVVKAWDSCGGAASANIDVTVIGTTLSNMQAAGGWNQWGELPPIYDICNAPCPGVNWKMTQHVSSPSLSGNATRFDIGGTKGYSDVLWSNPIIGQGAIPSRQDVSHTWMPTLHNFIVDTDFYVTNLAVTQDLEFDVNMYYNGIGMEWGTECNHLADGAWDIWDNVNVQWVATTIPCALNNKAWNHVTLQVQRQPNNDLLYQTLTVNGVVYNINQTMAPFSVPPGWYGSTVNYQMDGNYFQNTNTTYLDNLSVTYW
ncbi:MAG TPA: hypothetical protein VGD64_01160 [Acidisarcina sp.]